MDHEPELYPLATRFSTIIARWLCPLICSGVLDVRTGHVLECAEADLAFIFAVSGQLRRGVAAAGQRKKGMALWVRSTFYCSQPPIRIR
jgi:hypothetical protein